MNTHLRLSEIETQLSYILGDSGETHDELSAYTHDELSSHHYSDLNDMSNPITRVGILLKEIEDKDGEVVESSISRIEQILYCILYEQTYGGPVLSRIETYLAAIANKYEEVPEPQSRVEELLKEWFEKTK